MRFGSLSKTYQKRTIRPLYGTEVVVPEAHRLYGGFYNSNHKVYPGMVAAMTEEGIDVAALPEDQPYGLFANFIGGEWDELNGGFDVGIFTKGVFEILATDNIAPFDYKEAWLASSSKGAFIYSAAGMITLAHRYRQDLHGGPIRPVGTLLDSFERQGHSYLIVELDCPTESTERSPYLLGYNGLPFKDPYHPDYLMGKADAEGDAELQDLL